jgi:hypothetical protein
MKIFGTKDDSSKDVSELAHARQNKDNDNEIKHVSHYYSY